MASDIYLTTDRDLMFDATGDIRIASGTPNVYQQHVNAAFRAIEGTDSQLFSPELREDLSVAIRRELDELSYVNEIIELTIERAGHNRMTITIQTNATTEPIVETTDLP